MLFRGKASTVGEPSPNADEGGDPVLIEAAAFAVFAHERVQRFFDGQGLLNEFKLFTAMKLEMPLHYRLFCMTAPHLAHEGNVESSFSTVKLLEDPNTGLDFLSKMVRVAGRKKLSKPANERIWREYQARHHNHDNSVESIDDSELCEEAEEEMGGEECSEI